MQETLIDINIGLKQSCEILTGSEFLTNICTKRFFPSKIELATEVLRTIF